jgi:hypothetical protein
MKRDAHPRLDSLEPEQMQALHRWRLDHGRCWKDALRWAWMDGSDERAPKAHALRQVRNLHGPSFLESFTTAQLDAAVARLPAPAASSERRK